MKPIVFSQHALDSLDDRGASREEVEEAIRTGEQVPAKLGRVAFRKNYPFHATWKGKHYETKQVMPVVADEQDRWVLITVYAFFIGGAR